MKKRIFARALALFMALSLLSTTALAASFADLQDAIDGTGGTQIDDSGRYGYAWNQEANHWGVEAWTTTGEDGVSNRNVQLNENVTDNTGKNITVSGADKDVTLDLNGYNVEGEYKGGYTDGMIEVSNGASLTVENTTSEDGSGTEGKIVNNSTADTVKVNENSTVTLNDGTIATDTGVKSVLVNNGTFNMNGGEINGGAQNALTVMGNSERGVANLNGGLITGSNQASVTAQGGTVNVNEGAVIKATHEAGIHASNGGTVNISGGSVTGVTAGVSATNDGHLTLTGGSIRGELGTSGNHADIELSNGGNTATISEGVDFRTLGIQGDIDGRGVSNIITVAGKYKITYTKAADSEERTVTIESLDGSEVPPVLYDIAKKMVVKDNDKNDANWKWIILGPDAISDPFNQIPDTTVDYLFKSGTEGVELPDDFPKAAKDADTSDIQVTGGKWVFKEWTKDPFANLTDVDGNAASDATTAMFDQDGKHVDKVIIEGTWVFVADTPDPETPDPETPDPEIPVNPAIPEDGPVFDVPAGGAATTTIEDEEIPLANLLTLADLLEALREHEEIPEIDLPEDFKWIDHELAQAIYWGLQEELVVDTEDDPLDPDELLTVGLMREVLTNYVEIYVGLDDFVVELEGEDEELVMDYIDLYSRLAVFYEELEAALEEEAA